MSALRLTRSLFLLFICFLCIFNPVHASSNLRNLPVKRATHPSTVSFRIVPRPPPSRDSPPSALPHNSPALRHSDSLRITLNAYGETFHLHLRPHDTFIHPAARITYLRTPPDGGEPVVDRVEPLLRETVRVYTGDVVSNDETEARLAWDAIGGRYKHRGQSYPGDLGWAHIMVHDDGTAEGRAHPVFEGAFSVRGDIHHILTRESFYATRLYSDPDPLAHNSSEDVAEGLVVFRDSDMMTAAEYEALRTDRPLAEIGPVATPQMCAHERLNYNVDRLRNPVLRFGAGLEPERTAWYDPLGVLGPVDAWAEVARDGDMRVAKRQGDIGAGNGTAGSSNFVDRIGQEAGCPTSQKIVYVGVAADCEYTTRLGGNSNATTSVLKSFNTASLLFKSTFNISLGVIELLVQDGACPAVAPASAPWNVPCNKATLNDRLSLFSEWRGQKGGGDGAGLWHLMTGCPTGTEVGVAWLGTVCVTRSGGDNGAVVSGTGVSTAGKTEWQVVAHEIGHNFGAIHDCAGGCTLTDTCCPRSTSVCDANGGFLMSPTSSDKQTVFSPCTVGNICSLMLGGSVDYSCVQEPNPSQRTLALQMCGNGIVEAGEECDPGQGVQSDCCDTTTCKLLPTAQCDPTNSPCCTQSCSFAPSTQTCRIARDATCDKTEFCTGSSATCPGDITATNGLSCGANGLACAMGQCTSVSQQCRVVGASLNLTTACPSNNDRSCQVSCQDPKNPNACVVLQSQLIDGSPCGYGGMCVAGNCQPGSPLDTFKAWYMQNLTIAIPVTVVVGIVLLLILWAIILAIKRCCCQRTRPKPTVSSKAIPSNMRGQRLPSWSGPTPTFVGPNGPDAGPASRPGQPPRRSHEAPVQSNNLRPPAAGHARSASVDPQRPTRRQGSSGPNPPNMAGIGAAATRSRPLIAPERLGPAPPTRGDIRPPPQGAIPAALRPGAGGQAPPGTTRANWVDPTHWNGPMRR